MSRVERRRRRSREATGPQGRTHRHRLWQTGCCSPRVCSAQVGLIPSPVTTYPGTTRMFANGNFTSFHNTSVPSPGCFVSLALPRVLAMEMLFLFKQTL